MKTKGKLIAFEGIDGSGTSTQVRRVSDYFWDKTENGILTTFEPSSGPIGKVIRSWLQKELPKPSNRMMTVSFIVDRLHHWATAILPALGKGQHVFTDRFSLSTLVYQGFYSSLPWIGQLDKLLKVPDPDLTLVLDLSVEEAFSRIDQRGEAKEIYEELELQKSLRCRYLDIPKRHGMSHKIIDASKSKEEVTKKIIEILKPLLL